MPLPENDAVVETAKNIVGTLKDAFETPPGFRPGRKTAYHKTERAVADYIVQLTPKAFC